MKDNSIQPIVDIVIVNWNSGQCLKNLFDSICLISSLDSINKIVIVDNLSVDQSLDFLKTNQYPFAVDIIYNHHNKGFGSACNQAAKNCQAKYLLFLNPDTLLLEDSLSTPLKFLDEHSDYAACGIQLINENRIPMRSCARVPRSHNFIFGAFGLDILFPKTFRGLFMREWDHLESRDTDHVIGAFYLIKRDIFESLNGFDEQFFLYFEDLDLSANLKDAGHKIRYLANSKAIHIGGGCSKNIKSKRLYYSIKSKILYISKHFPIYKSAGLLFVILIIEPIFRTIFYLKNRSSREAINSFKVWWLLIRDFFSPKKKLLYKRT